MALIDLLKNVPDIGKETLNFIIKPKDYIIKREGDSKKFISVAKTFLWLMAISLLLLKIYSTLFIPINEDVLQAGPINFSQDTTKVIVVIPFFFMLFRGYFLTFSELYRVKKRKLLLGSAMSGLLSWIISPLVFIPLLYLALWLIPIFDLII